MSQQPEAVSTPTAGLKRVIFRLDAPQALQVSLAGDFNDWDPRTRPLKPDKNGVWRASFDLPPGRYEYRFLVDGQWQDDPRCEERVPNEFGSHNCVKVVKP